MAVQVVIIEPNFVLRESLKQLLLSAGYGVGDCVSSLAMLDQNAALDGTVVILSWQHADVFHQIGLIKSRARSARVIILGSPDDLHLNVEAIQKGASACLSDVTSTEAFYKALDLAALGLAALSLGSTPGEAAPSEHASMKYSRIAPAPSAHRNGSAAMPSPPPPPQQQPEAAVDAQHALKENGYRQNAPSFSPREASVLELLREGAPNKLIARRLSLTEATVKVHLKSILRKISAKNRTQAAIWAMAQSSGVAFDPQSSPMRPIPARVPGAKEA